MSLKPFGGRSLPSTQWKILKIKGEKRMIKISYITEVATVKKSIKFTIMTRTSFALFYDCTVGNWRKTLEFIYSKSRFSISVTFLKKGNIFVIELIGGFWTLSIGDLIDIIFIFFAKSHCTTHCLFQVQRIMPS